MSLERRCDRCDVMIPMEDYSRVTFTMGNVRNGDFGFCGPCAEYVRRSVLPIYVPRQPPPLPDSGR